MNIIGTGGNATFIQNVQAYSMEQVSAPAGNFGDFYICVSNASNDLNWWTA